MELQKILDKLEERYGIQDEGDIEGKSLFVIYQLLDLEYENELFKLTKKMQKQMTVKKRPKTPDETRIDLRTFAQNKALKEENYSEYNKLKHLKEHEIQQHLFKQAESPKQEMKHEKSKQKKDNGVLLHDSNDSSSSLNSSILEEYWEDFDAENQINEEKRKFKFMDLDKSFNDPKALEKFQDEIFKEFDPENPPVLDYYDTLMKKYKLPSRTLLEFERDCYRKYIKMLKKVNKVLVRRAKKQARDTARKVVINHTGSSRAKFDKEIVHILLQFDDVRTENYNKTKKIADLEEKMKRYELTLSQTANYFRKCEFDFEMRLEEKEKATKGRPGPMRRRRAGKLGAENLQLPSKANLSYSELIFSKPFNFYSMYYKVNDEERDKML